MTFSATLVHHEVHGLEKLLGLLLTMGEFMSCVCVPLNRGQKKSSILHRTDSDSEPWAFPVMLPQPPMSMVSVGGPILE